MVLGLFWVTFLYQKDDQKQNGRFVEMLVLLNEIAVFMGCGRHLGCQKERKTECESDPDSNSVL